ncbi:MAG: molybdopterin-guanine dinucleotide biosynthesis protein MobB, partial [Saprospiraceae bacterium]|nr:molybdopterin-guanine dinucleotide biosynthesis protein MobB [Saprospiraceae bacterium]
MLHRLDGRGLDLILVEGFKHAQVAKIELHRPSLGHALLCRDDTNVIAVASDSPVSDVTVPLLNLNDPVAIARFIRCHVSA